MNQTCKFQYQDWEFKWGYLPHMPECQGLTLAHCLERELKRVTCLLKNSLTPDWRI